MERVTDPNTTTTRIDDQAAQWLVRLGAQDLDASEQAAFAAWLAVPAHRAAYDRARRAWADMGKLGHARARLLAEDSPRRSVVSLGQRSARPMATVAALAACLLLLLTGAGLWSGSDPFDRLLADYATGPGETRTVVLPDGSRATLGPASALSLAYSDDARRVEVVAGVALFEVAPVADTRPAPFSARAERGSARALGTRFMVDTGGDGVEVTVIEHAVAVTLPAEDGAADGTGQERRLEPGQAVHYDDQGLGTVRTVNVDHATAWRRHRLIFDKVPLSTVVETLNRYRHGRIVIADPGLASRSVSGVFDTTRLDEALGTITATLGIDAMSVPPVVTVLY